MAQQPLIGQNHLYEFPLSHSDTPHSIAALWTNDRPVNPTKHNTPDRHQFEPATPASDHALDHATISTETYSPL